MNQANQKATEQRKKQRFPLRREMRYKVYEGEKLVATGTGATLDIGSGGVCFIAEGNDLKAGREVELSISWPVLLNDSCPLRLVTNGRVLRSSGSVSACTITKFEYRTQGKVTQMPLSSLIPAMRERKSVAAAS